MAKPTLLESLEAEGFTLRTKVSPSTRMHFLDVCDGLRQELKDGKIVSYMVLPIANGSTEYLVYTKDCKRDS